MESIRHVTKKVAAVAIAATFFTLFFKCTSMTTTITCKIVNANNEPVKDAIVMVIGGSNSFPELAAVTNDDGVASLINITVPGSYDIQISYAGKQKTHNLQCTAEKTSFTIVW